MRWADDLGDEQAERFSHGLNFLFNDWVKRFGPVKDCDVRTRKFSVREMRTDARRRYEHDIGASYALEFLAFHIEASYLPGEDAASVYDLTSQTSLNGAMRRAMRGKGRSRGGTEPLKTDADAFSLRLRLAAFHRRARMAGGRASRSAGPRPVLGACRMRLATLAALAGIVGLAEPAFALDKVRFGTNWLADPEAGGFFQAAADGTYAKYGLDVTVIPGGPQSNGGLMLLFGKIDFFMGGDMIGNYLSAESKAAAHRGRRRLSEVAANPHVASRRRARQMGGLAGAEPDYVGAGAINTFYAWLRIAYGFKDENIRPYNFNSAPFMKNKMSIQQGYVTAEPYEIEKQGGFKPNVFLLSDYGY